MSAKVFAAGPEYGKGRLIVSMLSKPDDVTLLRYSEDDLSEEERLAVEAALAEDDTARADLRMLVLTSGILRDPFKGFDRPPEAGLTAEKIESDRSSDDGADNPATLSLPKAPAASVDASPQPSPQAMEPEHLQPRAAPAPARGIRRSRRGKSRRHKRSVVGLFILLAAEVALVVVGVGLYFYFLAPAENEPGPVARASSGETENADVPPEPKPPRVVKGQLAFQEVVDRMPSDWNKQVFEADAGDVKVFALLNGGEVTFKVGEKIMTPGRPPCRETVVDVVGPRPMTLKMQVCEPRDGVW